MKLIKRGPILIILFHLLHSKKTETDSGKSGKLGHYYISV